MQKSKDHFASGWCWLVWNRVLGIAEIIDTHDAYNPINDNKIPLLTLDLWEHAFYIDYITEKTDYAKNFFNYVNWEYVESRMDQYGI